MPATPATTIRRASAADVDAIAPLFDAYRQFYRKPTDLVTATAFLTARLERGESTILAAYDQAGDVLGFTQIYPGFSSVSAAPAMVLNDLFVIPDARRRGIGRLLIDAAVDFARAQGACHIALSTEIANARAQALYEAAGWKRETEFYTYGYSLTRG